MKFIRLFATLLMLCMVVTMVPADASAAENESTPMYRLYNPNSGEHFYTGSMEERDILVDAGWKYEGVAWNAPVSGGVPVHRVYNPNSGDHHYTADTAERDWLVGLGWKYEGVCWNSVSENGVAQYRLWNPNADLGSHHYTSSEEERDWLVDLGWVFEGIGWYGVGSSSHSHSYTSKVTEPTCTEKGYTTYSCTCGHSYTDDETPAKGHSWDEWEIIKNATCSEEGEIVYTCGCGDSYTSTISKSAHSWGRWTTIAEPTATTAGSIERACTECGEKETTVIEALGSHTHSWSEWSTVMPTCTEAPYRYRTCSCGYIETESTGGSAYGHYFWATSEKDGKLEYTCFLCGDTYIEDTEYLYDESLSLPEVESIFLGSSNATLSCLAGFGDGSGYGYQGYISATPDFSGTIREARADHEWNGLGYVSLNFFNYSFDPGTYYYKVRTYRMDGETFVYGPWSEVMSVESADYDTKLDQKPLYTYDLYFLDDLGTDLYTGINRAIYIRTENPDVNTIRLVSGDKQIMMNYNTCDDVEFMLRGDHDEWLRKVPGGYLGMLNVANAGSLTIEVREGSAEGYVAAKEFQVNVLDYETAQNQWIDDAIAAQTDNSMNPKEKMDAIAEYLTNGQFGYVTNSGGTLVNLAAEPNSPWFATMRWDSYTSPGMLTVFAERIGGFEEIHNCYSDYPIGSEEWQLIHAKAYVVYGGEKYYYVVCPSMNSGDVGQVEKIDFSDTAQFTHIA